MPVGRLSTAAAVAMLGRLVGRSRITPEDAAAALVARCDHLALAVRAAAAVLIDDPRLGLAELAARLSADSVLDELAVDDLDPRARLLARYREMSTVDQVAAAAFQYLGTDGVAPADLSPAVAPPPRRPRTARGRAPGPADPPGRGGAGHRPHLRPRPDPR